MNNPPKPKQTGSIAALFIILGGVLLLAASVFFVLRRSPTADQGSEKGSVTGAPAIRLDKENVDLGTIKLGQTVNVSFEITNAGDRPLRFTEAPYVEVLEGC